MDATIESDTSQNTNSLISSGYFIENYSEDDSDKENTSTNNTDAILKSSEDKKHWRSEQRAHAHFQREQIASRVCFFVMVLYPLFN